jgi:outer membrane lipoprotein carrier protein
MRNAELRCRRRAADASPRSGRWSCHSAFRIPHSAFVAVGISLALQTPDPWPILDRASQTYQTVTSLSADFVQIITNPMIGAPDTTRGRLYQMRPSRFAMRFTDPKGDRIVADGRFLWLYTPSTTPGQVIRSRIPEYGTTGPNLIGQFVEQPRERYTAHYVRADSLPDGRGLVDVIGLVPKGHDQPYDEATIWVGREDGLVHRVDIKESSGQERTVILRKIRANGGVPGRELTFSPPAGVRVVDQ